MLDTAIETIVRAEVMSQLNHTPVVLKEFEKLKITTEKQLRTLNNKVVNLTDGHSFNKKKVKK
tara:strand:- start:32 stop:220 length:189 start_codon:yes stop_codon:yes gene_type:complete